MQALLGWTLRCAECVTEEGPRWTQLPEAHATQPYLHGFQLLHDLCYLCG